MAMPDAYVCNQSTPFEAHSKICPSVFAYDAAFWDCTNNNLSCAGIIK